MCAAVNRRNDLIPRPIKANEDTQDNVLKPAPAFLARRMNKLEIIGPDDDSNNTMSIKRARKAADALLGRLKGENSDPVSNLPN